MVAEIEIVTVQYYYDRMGFWNNGVMREDLTEEEIFEHKLPGKFNWVSSRGFTYEMNFSQFQEAKKKISRLLDYLVEKYGYATVNFDIEVIKHR